MRRRRLGKKVVSGGIEVGRLGGKQRAGIGGKGVSLHNRQKRQKWAGARRRLVKKKKATNLSGGS